MAVLVVPAQSWPRQQYLLVILLIFESIAIVRTEASVFTLGLKDPESDIGLSIDMHSCCGQRKLNSLLFCHVKIR